jgi:outer membrane protein OmpA-like peptidoglycan-associated protein
MKSIFHSTPRSRRARPQQHEAQPELQGAFFQPKLTINQPGDPYEREADAVADRVVGQQNGTVPNGGGAAAVQRMPISKVQRLATPDEQKMPGTNDARMEEDKQIQEKPEEGAAEEEEPIQKMEAPKEEEQPVQKAAEEEEPVQAKAEEEEPVQKMDAPKEEEKPVQKAAEEEEPVQAKAEEEEPVQKMDAPKEEEKPVQKAAEEEEPVQAKSQTGRSQAPPNFGARLSARKGGGSPLPAPARAQMEQGIGADFSQVRIHTDPEAVGMNKAIHAQAFTHGSDVYFNSGKFSPESMEGKRLLAHELVHTVQQQGALRRQPDHDASAGGGGWGSGIRNWWGDVTNSRSDEARLDAEEDLADFMGQTFSVENHHPSTGIGLFNAAYQPATGTLDINLKVNFNFLPGDPTNPDWVSAVGGAAAAAAFAPDQFQWTPDETTGWKQNAIRDIRSAWQDQYIFHTTKPYWNRLPSVHTHINIVEADAKNAHFNVSVRKWPRDVINGSIRDSVTHPGASNQGSAQFEEGADDGITNPDSPTFTRSTGSQPEYNSVNVKNPGKIQFEQGSAEVKNTDSTRLTDLGSELGINTIPAFPVRITGRSSAEGNAEKNMNLSFQRALNVSNIIVSAGAKHTPTVIPEGENGATNAPEWRRAEIQIEPMTTQMTTLTHEFGHMFGLPDEYPDTGRPVGTSIPLPGGQSVSATDSDSMMSVGSTVYPHHYSTFMEVLGIMSNTTGQWSTGPGPGGHAHEPGDFPMPPRNGPQYA